MRKLMHWLSRVAMAAPAVPRFRPGRTMPKGRVISRRMKMGSRTIFRIPPMVMPAMERVACPSARRTLLSTKEAAMMGAPKRMYCA